MNNKEKETQRKRNTDESLMGENQNRNYHSNQVLLLTQESYCSTLV
jgi:hypothetical protein